MNVATRWILAFACAIASPFAAATAQIPDSILVDGKPGALFAEPLNPLLDDPAVLRRVQPHLRTGCSANWRGYVAAWEIRDARLWLVEVEEGGCRDGGRKIPLATFVAGAKSPLEASWFSGVLTIPQGKQVRYVHMGYLSEYESYLVVHVEKGRITRQAVEKTRPGPK